MSRKSTGYVVSSDWIDGAILLVRKQRVMLDFDLARLYGTTTRRLNEQVKRNRARFPSDFIFQLTQKEKDELVAGCDRLSKLKHSSTLPRAFTEHGAVMAASVLNSPRAVEVSVCVVRAFIRMREMLASQRELAGRVDRLERQMVGQDARVAALFDAIRQLMNVPRAARSTPIGFKPDE